MKDRLQKFIDIRPVVVEGEPDAHNVFLQVINQRFCVTPYACDTKEDAEWTADMLAVALEKIVLELSETTKLSHQTMTLLDCILELYCEDRLVRGDLLKRIENIVVSDWSVGKGAKHG